VINIKPGNPELLERIGAGTTKSIEISTQDAALDLIRNMFPENIVQAAIQQGQTFYTYEDKFLNKTLSRHTHTAQQNRSKSFINHSFVVDDSRLIVTKKKVWHFKYNDNMNIMGIIFFCIALGMVISK